MALPTLNAHVTEPADARPRAAVVQTAWARLLLHALARAGIKRAVISPGSRSTPFTLAAEHVGMHTTTIIDERSAGFVALGCARACCEPVLLICTSGSAGAHYLPALIEAAYAHVPLIVLTADRPPELMACAAPQTIDQTKLYGDQVRWFSDLGAPDESRASLCALVRKAVQAVSYSLAPVPGPVHLNAPARKPLEPCEPQSAAEIALVERSEAVLRGFSPRAIPGHTVAPDDMVTALARACAASERGLIVAGPALSAPIPAVERQRRAVRELARLAGFPMFVEASSQLRFSASATSATTDDALVIDSFDLLLANQHLRRTLAPDLIVQIGPPPTSRHWADFLSEHPDCVHCVLAPHGWNDPFASAELLLAADPADALERVIEDMREQRAYRSGGPAPGQNAWVRSWSESNKLAWRAVEEALAGTSSESPGLREGQAMRAAVGAIPRGAQLLLGNSLPIRTIDTYVPHHRAELLVLSQRGANGIDGFLSAAAGAAWSHEAGGSGAFPRPTVAIIGDVAFVHDLGGLYAAARVHAPLCIVIIDNRGGRIFDSLPIAELRREPSGSLYDEYFLTPPNCDMRAAAAVFGAHYQAANTETEVHDAVARACTRSGVTIVHARVQAESAAEDRARIDGELARLLTAEWQPGERLGETNPDDES